MKMFLLAMMCAAAGAASAEANQVVVLEGARLIDGTGKAPRENSVIVVQGDRITAVGTLGKVKVPKGARVVDVRGRTIMPGLINAHGHVGLVADGKNRADAYTRENILPRHTLILGVGNSNWCCNRDSNSRSSQLGIFSRSEG